MYSAKSVSTEIASKRYSCKYTIFYGCKPLFGRRLFTAQFVAIFRHIVLMIVQIGGKVRGAVVASDKI